MSTIAIFSLQLKPNFGVSKVKIISTIAKKQYVSQIFLGFNKRPNIGMFNINCSYSDQLNRLFRFESNLTIKEKELNIVLIL